MKKKILIIDGHLYEEGLASRLARQYLRGAEGGGHEVKFVEIRNLRFNPILKHGYKKRTELETDLVAQQDNIKWCDHLVLATPIWWMGLPAMTKGFVERVFLPGFAFSYEGRRLLPKKMLKGKTMRLIYTQGAFRWMTALIFDIHWLVMKIGIFMFVGFWPAKRFVVGGAEKMSKDKEERVLKRAFALGKRGR